jgi:Cd2+/Zn2+-exporting ATPase
LDEEREKHKVEDAREEESFAGPWWRFRPFQGAALSGVLLGLGVLLSRLAVVPDAVTIGFYIAAIPPGAFTWAREGFTELVKERAIGNEALMAAATVGACVLGAWEEAAFLVFLYGSAEAIEEYTTARTRSAIRALLDLAPKEAHVLRDGEEVTVLAADLVPGDMFVVRPGEGIPTDGVIRDGHAALDEATVTGESVPVEKGPDALVFAGTLNRTGALRVEATKRFEDNTLSTIIHMVQEAQERKGGAQIFIERFGRRYSPAVLLVALAMLAAPAVLGADVGVWAGRAIVLLVAAAPCALVMSTPVAVAAAIGRAGSRGVLIKGGMALEALGRVRVVAMDKTGTLTRGEPEVTDIVPAAGRDRATVLQMAASVEHLSEHPLARAIVRCAHIDGIELLAAAGFVAQPGAGATANISGRAVTVGSPASFTAAGLDLNAIGPDVERLQNGGKTVVLARDQDSLLGALALQDQVRPEAARALRALHALGVRVAMLTGDNRRTAEAVAKALGIDVVHAELRPDEKVRLVEEMGARDGHVAMVGDGINDAPALAAAHVGIAMGAAGTDAAIEAADVALMADDLERVAYAVRLGRRARTISRQNITFSLLVLAVLVPSAILGLLGVAMAVVAHEVSELLAVANGLRAASDSEYFTPTPSSQGMSPS